MRLALRAGLLMLCVALGACAHTAIDEADRLARNGDYETAVLTLDRALARDPDNARLRSEQSRQRERVAVQALAQVQLALAAGQLGSADLMLQRLRHLDPQQPRLPQLQASLAAAQAARETANAGYRRSMQARASEPLPPSPTQWPAELGAAFQKTVTLALRDAPLRQLFESLAQASGLNFVFDRDVRGDAKATIFLKDVTLDEALQVVLATHGLDRKLLNGRTLMIYPDTPAKQRDHREMVTRTLYMVNAEAKQALALVRTMTKTRDLFADERLNALVVRDTPEVVAQVEQMLALVDLPEPEVLLDIEVMEVATSQIESLGLRWPDSIAYGLPGVTGQVELSARGQFRASIANPAVVATLRGDSGDTNLLANPTIRARHHEKAKVQIGEKLPVFSTTSVVNAGVSTSVSYLDVGLKLDIEPSIQLDDEVIMKLSLEVSNLVREVSGPQGSLAYQVGTRLTSTSLRLKDGETQVLAGLINDEDRKRATGVPGLSRLPLIGRLFGVHGDTRNKTEIVMLITPHIVRRMAPPSVQAATLSSGTDARPGAPSLRLRESAGARLPMGAAGTATSDGASSMRPAEASKDSGAPGAGAAAESQDEGHLELVATGQSRVGATVSVSLANRSPQPALGALLFDAQALRPLLPGADASLSGGRIGVELHPGEQKVWLFRVLAPAAGRTVPIEWQGEADRPRLKGSAAIRIQPRRRPPESGSAAPAGSRS